MAFTLWLSADEERILERIMRADGTRNKQQAVIQVIREKGATLAAERQEREIPVDARVPTSAPESIGTF